MRLVRHADSDCQVSPSSHEELRGAQMVSDVRLVRHSPHGRQSGRCHLLGRSVSDRTSLRQLQAEAAPLQSTRKES